MSSRAHDPVPAPASRPESRALQVDFLESQSDLDAMAESWPSLLARCDSRSVFARWEYLGPYYRHLAPLQGRPCLAVAWRGGQPVAAVPFVAWSGTLGRVPLRRLDLVGHQWDTSEVIASDRDADPLLAILDRLLDRGRFDVASVGGLAPGSALCDAVLAFLRERRIAHTLAHYTYAIVDLSGGYEAYGRAKGSNFRRNLRRQEERMGAAGGATLDRCAWTAGREERGAYVERLFSIADRSWKAREGGPMSAAHRRFIGDVIAGFGRSGDADVAILRIAGADAAFFVGLRSDAEYYDFAVSYDDAFESYSPGNHLMQLVLRALSSEAVIQVVSHGMHDYKRRWATAFVPQARLFVFPGTIRGRMSRLARFTLPGLWRRPRELPST